MSEKNKLCIQNNGKPIGTKVQLNGQEISNLITGINLSIHVGKPDSILINLTPHDLDIEFNNSDIYIMLNQKKYKLINESE